MVMMKKFFTTIGKGHGSPCLPATEEDWKKWRNEPWLLQMCERIRKGDEELKHRLPVWTPHCAEFKNNHRAIADAVKPLNRLMLDFDEKGHTSDILESLTPVPSPEERGGKDTPATNANLIAAPTGGGLEGALTVLLVEESVRGGTHVLVELPEGMEAEKAQELMKEVTGFEPDKAVKDVSRCIYMVPESYTRFVSEKFYEAEAYPSPPKGKDVQIPNSAEKTANQTPPPSEGLGEAEASPRTLYIFDACMKEAELTPDVLIVEGHRHEALKSILSVGATQLLKKPELMGVLKVRMAQNWQDKNIRQLVDDFYSKYYDPNQKMSQFQRKVLAKSLKYIEHGSDPQPPNLGGSDEGGSEEDVEEEETTYFTLPASLKKNLAIGLKESLVGVPASMHMPVLCAVLPIAAAYADQVEVQYCDGNRQRLGLMSIIRGEQASGKSVCKNVVDVWKRQFDEEDAIARKREEEWKERKKGRKANEKAPDDPKVLIRTVPVTVSCSTLLKRFKNANGHCLYSFGEELDTLRKTNGAGSWSSKYDIYRLSFDNGEWGQDYNSDQAESGVVKVAYNWTLLGTDGAMRKCFKADNIENGLSSRVMVAEMPDSSFAKMPKYGKRSADDEAKIQEAVTRLRSYSGFVDTPRLRKAIEEWVEEKRVEAAKDIDRVKDVYRKRAAVIGFRCGVIHFLLARRETKATIDFAVMMAEYVLEQQIKAFGEALQKEYVEASEKCQRYGVNHSVFDQLPPVFNVDDLKALKHGYCTDQSLRVIVCRWRHDGWIEKTDSKHWKKVVVNELDTENQNATK